MSDPREPQPQDVAVELLTLRFGPDGMMAVLNHWNRIEEDWGSGGHTTAFLGLLDLNIKLLNTLAQVHGVPEDQWTEFAVKYLRQHALNESQREDPWPGDKD
ncbi:hypothetical protein ABZZ74_43595 [Streptomyces sp. NPDC006476]|uniref:hypothetical protein n=1 Tax=Streptomyces sp. NPDC006476 TaxID=3157175 RepID=UPI0033B6064B